VYTIHLVCRVPHRKHETSFSAPEGEGAGLGRTGALSGAATSGPTGAASAAEFPDRTGASSGQEVQDWMRYMYDLTNNSSQLSEENLQQVEFLLFLSTFRFTFFLT